MTRTSICFDSLGHPRSDLARERRPEVGCTSPSGGRSRVAGRRGGGFNHFLLGNRDAGPKDRLGFLIDPHAWRRDLLNRGLIEIPVDGDIASRAGLLAKIHGDPADRIIVATALEGHRLMTADRLILGWAGPLTCLSATD